MDPRPWLVLILTLSLIPLIGSGISAEDTRAEGEEDNNNSFETAKRISEGSQGGMVSDGGSLGNDTDYYVISVPPFQTLGINVERFELWNGEVYATCYQDRGDVKPIAFIVSGSDGKKDIDYWVNRGSHTRDIYIKVSGDGMYFIETITVFDLSELVKPFFPPFALFGIFLALSVGLFIGLYIGKKNSGGIDERMERWGKKRKKGKAQFILQFGFSYGLCLVLILVPFHEMINSSHTMRTFLIILLLRTITFVGGGIVLSYFVWRQSEKGYLKWIEEKEKEKKIRPRWGRSRPGSPSH